jgi:uncharacterized protein (TIGR00159 family)
MNFVTILNEIGFSGFLDITVMSIIVYSILVWFKRTRTVFVVMGMFMLGGAYLLSRQLELSLTTTVFEGFFAVIIIAVVVIFQEEIKHFLEQLASRSMVRNRLGKKILPVARKEVDILVQTLSALAREHTGAIVVLRGKDPIVRHLIGGTDLDGELSGPLLRSIFDPNSPGHDGAVIIRGNRITEFSTHLPLSKNIRKLQGGGTRHAAALGLSELTDALCLVVSEERGTISVARNGTVKVVPDADKLQTILENFYEEVSPSRNGKTWQEFFKKNYREKAIAITVTIVLWIFFVFGSKEGYRTYLIPVRTIDLPTNLTVTSISPREIELTFSGSRRSFVFVNGSDFSVELSLRDIRRGTRTRTIPPSNILFPKGLMLESIQPTEVTVTTADKTP